MMDNKQIKEFGDGYRKLAKLLILETHKNMTDEEFEDTIDQLIEISEKIGELEAFSKIEGWISAEDNK